MYTLPGPASTWPALPNRFPPHQCVHRYGSRGSQLLQDGSQPRGSTEQVRNMYESYFRRRWWSKTLNYQITKLPRLLGQNDAHFLKSYFEIILLGWIWAVHRLMLHAHFEGPWFWLFFNTKFYKDGTSPAPPSVHHCVQCIIYDAHRGQGFRVFNAKTWAVSTDQVVFIVDILN